MYDNMCAKAQNDYKSGALNNLDAKVKDRIEHSLENINILIPKYKRKHD